VTGPSPLRIDVARALDEVRLILDWAAAEGWNPGLGDAEAFLAADPEGFLLGRLGGEPVAAISLVRYDERFAFLGCYVVRPDVRGQGHGIAIWRAAIERAAARTIGLDGVPTQQPKYRRSGFELERRNLRYSGVVRDVPHETPASGGHVDIARVPFTAIAAYDRTVFPADRGQFLERWVAADGHQGVAWLDGGAVLGYGVVRPCRSGWKIGPLFADDAAVAGGIFGALVRRIGEERVSFDVPETNPGAVAIAETAGLVVDFETARMYAGQPPGEDRHRVYGVTTFELG
jgi:GNAT superfamily N-acetyltransferase